MCPLRIIVLFNTYIIVSISSIINSIRTSGITVSIVIRTDIGVIMISSIVGIIRIICIMNVCCCYYY